MEAQTICAVCEKTSVLRCGACENVYYCSKQHQKKDWKRHVNSCKPYKLAENSALGRHYIATRNIKAGEIVLKEESPIVHGPMDNCVPICLRCFAVLNKYIAIPCDKCGWPLCLNCKSHGSECNFTSSRRDDKVAISEFGFPHPSYRCINLIRAMSLKETNPGSYRELLSLESHSDRMKDKNDAIFEDPLDTIRFVKRFFKCDDFTDDEMAKILGVVQINGHEVPLTEPSYVAVYHLASFLEHNCRANCSKSFTETGGLIIHAAMPINKGDHISICYTDPLWGTANRRHHLSKTKFFECTCDRCKDPTEFATMFSAIKCRETDNCPGFLLPETFLRTCDWKCGTCESSIANEDVEKLLESIGIYLSSMRKHDVSACGEFLSRHKTILHGNHFYNVDVTVALCQLIGQQTEGITTIDEDLLTEKMNACRNTAELLKILAPAENRIRGMILFELYAALAEFSRRHAGLRNNFLSMMQESKKCLLESRDLLKYEPEVMPEGKISLAAEKNLKEINEFVKQFNGPKIPIES